MRRREFLVSLAAGGAGFALVIRRTGCWKGQPLHLELTDFLTDAPSARLIGKAYLQLEPDERSEERLIDLVFPALRSAQEPPLRDEILAQFLASVRSDFEETRVVRIGGWLLSRTESRLCGLVALG